MMTEDTTANLELMRELSRSTPSKIVLIVLDGLGGLPDPETGKSEMETARTPNLDRLAAEGICGLSDPVSPGITPGSAPGHLALFGYDPVRGNVGRGVLETVGIDFDLKAGDVAARGNFCTVDAQGIITDRRAGRITTDRSTELCRILDGIKIDGAEVIVRPVKEHRFVAVFRGAGLKAEVSESDPQHTGMAPRTIEALSPEAGRTAEIANRFVAEAKKKLTECHPANMILLRGFSQHPDLPPMSEIYHLDPAVIAVYPMYRGLAKLVGMKALPAGNAFEEEFATLEKHYGEHDFFFLHLKGTDSAGEDGDFARKVSVLEEIDGLIPRVTALKPDVIVVTGDHSTPALLKGHSWHPVPVMLSGAYCRPDGVKAFNESACLAGGLGRLSARQIMPLAMANALKLDKFGA
ncbi:MAG: 2,3-bisphosphoglycerate-independent phosphoglycerate mutase [Chloroflexota bacterium]